MESKTDAPTVVPADDSDKSEEVQAIIDRMPTRWAMYVSILTAILMGLILLLGFIIKYPDTVDGPVSITATRAPVRLVANIQARLHLLKPDKSPLKKGDVIAYLESGTNYNHVLLLDSLLECWSLGKTAMPVLPDSFILGEISTTYNTFVVSHAQYQRLLSTDLYETMRSNLEHQIAFDREIIRNFDQELLLKKQILDESARQLHKDSILLSVKGISEVEYKQQLQTHLNLQQSLLSLQSNRFMKQSEISKNQLEIQRITLEETENKEKTYAELVSRKNELMNALNLWKERYMQYAPIDGELQYLGFWRDNSFVQSGQELFSILPDKNNILGEVYIPSYGAGKVEVGQRANVKINNYPYDEYGLLKGVVESVSRITNKIQTKDGTSDAYLVTIAFPDGMVTNYGKALSLDFETKGQVEIITRQKRLIGRLFDNIKSKSEK